MTGVSSPETRGQGSTIDLRENNETSLVDGSGTAPADDPTAATVAADTAAASAAEVRVSADVANAGGGAAGGPNASAAFAAGWLMADIYGRLAPADAPAAEPPAADAAAAAVEVLPYLPAVDDLDLLHRRRLAVADLSTELSKLGDAGLSATEVEKATDKDVKEFRKAVGALNLTILQRLGPPEAKLRPAYEAGMALGTLCWLPDKPSADDGADFARRLSRPKVADIQAWLDQASSALPAQSAAIVIRSLGNWQAWLDANSNQMSGSKWTDSIRPSVVAALDAQRRLWKGILSGDARTEPTIDAWIHAGESTVRTTRQLAAKILRPFWSVAVVVLAVVAGLVFLAINKGAGETKLWATMATIGGGFGVTGVSLRAAGKKAAGTIEQSVWRAADLDARAWAVTWLPSLKLGPVGRHRLAKAGVGFATVGSRISG
jgi:hypothetical protein